MFNPAETENEKDNPGVVARTFGIFAAVISVLLLLVQAAGGEPSVLPWAGLFVSFALIVIGYLQKIAAK